MSSFFKMGKSLTYEQYLNLKTSCSTVVNC